ncbi:carboxylesterase/lipase family protein [Streptomyces yaizuensis]|uniref:Carboxylic ester hydrolase n=1 Tax=Streptomyces yaizuensis TaxID=2989713 RepID=A0ABQ5P2Q8_9ACTN|nr:carboxylesterase family protein [Streptomyces sp. YSPA8]GLF96881.1 carboxylesterase family protein [Streptomyces sp. YSPA8]
MTDRERRRPRGLRALALALGVCALLTTGTGQAAGTAPVPGGRAPAEGPVVTLDTGKVRGTDAGETRVFSGIPYAQPPVGALRWRDPRPARPWTGVADATAPGQVCTQVEGARTVGGEDCLFVNVTAPERGGAKPLPVLVWLHGGGFTTGSGDLYDARRLAAREGVVVVTVNYRLGALGFLGLPGLRGSGTFGLADQLAALRWTQRNAAAFGGDRTRVTVAGESAGGMSVCALLTAPAARGLFSRAAVQSGACTLDWPAGMLLPSVLTPAAAPYTPLERVRENGRATAARLGCAEGDELGCMRSRPAAEVLSAMGQTGSPAYGGELLPEHPSDALRAGRFLKVPVLLGTTRDEGRGFVSFAPPVTAQGYGELLRSAFGDRAETVARRYPLSAYAQPALAWSAVSTDRSWACPTLAAGRLLARHTPVHLYEFADPDAPAVVPVPAGFPSGAAHGSELPYLFDLGGVPWPGLAAEQWRLADRMSGYWGAFARTGVPRAADAPAWPRFTAREETVLALAPGPGGIAPTAYGDRHQCGFWEALGR